jgi:hypothetical protein
MSEIYIALCVGFTFMCFMTWLGYLVGGTRERRRVKVELPTIPRRVRRRVRMHGIIPYGYFEGTYKQLDALAADRARRTRHPTLEEPSR